MTVISLQIYIYLTGSTTYILPVLWLCMRQTFTFACQRAWNCSLLSNGSEISSFLHLCDTQHNLLMAQPLMVETSVFYIYLVDTHHLSHGSGNLGRALLSTFWWSSQPDHWTHSREGGADWHAYAEPSAASHPGSASCTHAACTWAATRLPAFRTFLV